MARTYLTGNNSRGSIITGMSATFSHLRGWDAGVKVEFYGGDKKQDVFHVYMTDGSNGYARRHLGVVKSTENGPVWVPHKDEEPE